MGAEAVDLLSWQDMFGWKGLLLLMLGLPVTISVALRPKWFWPLLIISSIVGIGPAVGGYFILDELFAGAIVLGGLMLIAIRGSQSDRDVERRASGLRFNHRFVYSVWAGYMIVQSIRGVLVTGDSRMARWVVLYVVVALLSQLACRTDLFEFPSPRAASLLILTTTILYYIAYLAQGVYWDFTLAQAGLWGELGRFQSQQFFWSGSAFAVFPTLVATPASIMLFRYGFLKDQILVIVTFVIMCIVGFYFDSRMSFMVMAGFLCLSLPRLGARNVVLIVLIFSLLYVGFTPDPSANIADFLLSFAWDIEAIWSPGENYSNVTRNAHLRAGIMAALDDPTIFLVGAGVYAHRTVLGPYLVGLYEKYLPKAAYTIVPGSRNDPAALTVFRSTAFTALLVDTGVIGVLLFAMNFVVTAHKLLKREATNRPLFMTTAFMAFMWLLVSNILDIILLYLLIMPGGILYWWGREPVRATSAESARERERGSAAWREPPRLGLDSRQ